MEVLNLPDYSQQLRISPKGDKIFDPIRKKYVALSPEEWVRQNFLLYLTQELQFPSGLISMEMTLTLNGLVRRCDMVVFDQMGIAKLIVELKAPSVTINQKTFDQIATYNLKLNVDYLVVSNGMKHYCCKMDYDKNSYHFLEEIPKYKEIIGMV
ncbi:MAG: type I restriction enzyme HsdR N-terminal domain-containing protein [Salinivirgaceae bacterium]